MAKRRDGNVRGKVAYLKRQSSAQLLLSLSRQSTALYRERHYVGTILATADVQVEYKKAGPPISGVDRPMLDQLGAALRGTASIANGEEILAAVWERRRRKLCKELRICERFKPGDANLILAIWAILRRGQPYSHWEVFLIVAVVAYRLGPEWMCDCSQQAKAH